MNVKNMLHYINVTLAMLGIMFSFYVIGWVNADKSVFIGTLCFLLFLGCAVISTLSWVKSYDRNKTND